jgi:hypothetical protein
VGVGGRWNLLLLVHRFSDYCDLERLSLPEMAYTMVERRLILNRIGKGSCETHGKRPRI